MVNALTYYRRKYLQEAIESPLSQGDGDSLSNDLYLLPTEQSLVLKVTSQQYSDLLSSALNGAYTTFPEKYNEVIYPLIKAGKLSFCDEVLNCIQTDSDVANAIRQASGSQFYDINQTEDQTILDTDLMQGQAVANCDLDNLFGATTQLTDLLNTISTDVLELFETAFATPSRLGDVIEAIPGVGLLPVDDALQALEKFSQQVKSAYDAAYDTQLRDDFRCELHCIAQENCALTMEQVRDYFKGKITVDVSSATSFLTLINDILVNNWLGLQSVYMMHWFILDAIIFGTEVLGIDVNRLSNQIAIFWNDPDSDWNLLCDPCQQTWEQTWDFTIDNGATDGWAISTWGDGWFVGEGYRSQNVSNQELIYLANTPPVDIELTYASFTFASVQTQFQTGGGFLVLDKQINGVGTELYRESSVGKTINTTHVMYDGVAVTADFVRTANNPYLPVGKWYIVGATLRGEGVNPYA